jgi:D-alanyl-D-alanine carboxypeptidase
LTAHAKLIWGIFLIMTVLINGCGGSGVRQTPSLPAVQDPGLQKKLETWINEAGVPGAVLGLRLKDGRKYIVAAGISEITRQKDAHKTENKDGLDETSTWPNMAYGTQIMGEPMQPDLQFRIASLSKTFLAVTVMRLKEQQKLTLDDTVEKYLGNIVPQAKDITIKQLLGHQSGLPNYTDHPDFFKDLNADPSRLRTPEELLNYIRDMKALPPGKSYRYSNVNYLLLGMILEKVTGKPYNKVIQEQVLKPFNLHHAYIPNSPYLISNYTHGYRHDFKKHGRWKDYTQVVHTSWLGPSGAMVANADNLMTFMEYLFGGKLVTQTDLNQMMTFKKTKDPNRRAGLGLDQYKGAVGMSGDFVYGYEAIMYRYFNTDFVVLTNGLPTKLGVMNGAEWIFEQAVISALGFSL